jgi:pimeloyl-ACP methyl ester carboxylesterase
LTKRRTAVIATSIAAAAVAGGALGTAAARRRMEHVQAGETLWRVPPEDLGRVRSFDGTELAVRAAGSPDSPVLIFVHGLTLDMTIWLEQWPDLSVDLRCVTIDLRSHGHSDPAADGDMSLLAMGRDVAAVLEAVTPTRRAILIGHSLGGMAILAMAEEHPELFGPRVAGVMLIGSASTSLFRGAMGSVTDLLRPRGGSLLDTVRRVDGLRKALLAHPTDVGGAVARFTQFGPDAPGHIVDHVAGLARRTSSGVWSGGLAELMELNLRKAIPNVRVPALLLVGDHDRITPPGAAKALASELPQGRAIIIEGAGHMAMLERPHKVNLEIRGFAHQVLGPSGQEPKRKPKAASKSGSKSASKSATDTSRDEA